MNPVSRAERICVERSHDSKVVPAKTEASIKGKVEDDNKGGWLECFHGRSPVFDHMVVTGSTRVSL